MFKRIMTVLAVCFLLVCVNCDSFATDKKNPSREELERLMDEVAQKRGIPTVILKSVARVESVFKQYNKDGSVYTGSRGSIGIMQINNRSAGFDTNRLKYDIPYNIDAGATMLLRKWDTCVRKLPKFTEMDPNVLEHWYFALWAYNGWAKSNNPNTNLKKYAYQDLVFMIADKEYDQPITKLDPKLLPKSGLPNKEMVFSTPNPVHYGGINKYKQGDVVEVDVTSSLTLRDTPSGSKVISLEDETVLYVQEDPSLNEGYYWYHVKVKDTQEDGWVAGNWIYKIGEVSEQTENVDAPYKDVSNVWGLEYITKLKDMGVISDNDYFYPNKHITRQEFSVMIAKALKLPKSNIELKYEDKDMIKSWAVDYVKAATARNFFYGFEDNKFRPEYSITREEMSKILSTIVGIDSSNDELQFNDVTDISSKNIDFVRTVYKKGLMQGDHDNNFNPKNALTRQEACKIIVNLLEYIQKVNG